FSSHFSCLLLFIRPQLTTQFPYTTLFRSSRIVATVSISYEEEDEATRNEHPEWFDTDADGQVWYVADGTRRKWIPRNKRRQVLIEAHDNNCHIGIDRTLAILRPRVFWPEMARETKSYIRQCHTCATEKHSPIETAELAPFETEHLKPLDQWAVDIIGPLTVTISGNRYILAAQDRVSKWV